MCRACQLACKENDLPLLLSEHQKTIAAKMILGGSLITYTILNSYSRRFIIANNFSKDKYVTMLGVLLLRKKNNSVKETIEKV